MAILLDPVQAFAAAVKKAGGQSSFARGVGCTPGNINQLLRKKSLLPGKYVLKAEELTNISRHVLRPDLYGPEPSEEAAA